MHTHKDHHLILYLTEGAPLILPELKMTIMPKEEHIIYFHLIYYMGLEKLKKRLKQDIV